MVRIGEFNVCCDFLGVLYYFLYSLKYDVLVTNFVAFFNVFSFLLVVL